MEFAHLFSADRTCLQQYELLITSMFFQQFVSHFREFERACSIERRWIFAKNFWWIFQTKKVSTGLKNVRKFFLLKKFGILLIFLVSKNFATFEEHPYANSYDPGNFDECLKIKNDDYQGKYCQVQYYSTLSNVTFVPPCNTIFSSYECF